MFNNCLNHVKLFKNAAIKTALLCSMHKIHMKFKSHAQLSIIKEEHISFNIFMCILLLYTEFYVVFLVLHLGKGKDSVP